jgi:hypothetical protein
MTIPFTYTTGGAVKGGRETMVTTAAERSMMRRMLASFILASLERVGSLARHCAQHHCTHTSKQLGVWITSEFLETGSHSTGHSQCI